MPNLSAHSNLLRMRIFQAIALPGPNLRRSSSRTNHTEPAVKLVSVGFLLLPNMPSIRALILYMSPSNIVAASSLLGVFLLTAL